MARYWPQSVFTQRPFTDSSLNVHQWDRSETASPAERAIVFVHGLGGFGYRTWDTLPAIFFNSEGTSTDIGIFDYPSFQRRLGKLKTAAIPDVVSELADELADLPHKEIFLIGHSMGGVIASGAIMRLFMRDLSPYPLASKIAGLFAVASPRAGAVPAWLSWGRDLSFLKSTTAFQEEVARFFEDHVEKRMDPHPHLPLFIPTFSLLASRDRWVKSFSASFSIPSSQQRKLRGTHTSIIKNLDPNSTAVTWITQRLHFAALARTNWRKARSQPEGELFITDFVGHSSRPEWHSAFYDACKAVEVEEGISIGSPTGGAGRRDAVIRVLEARASYDAPSLELLTEVSQKQSGESFALGISPFGDACESAAECIRHTIGEGRLRWIVGTNSISDLRATLKSWIKLAAHAAIQRNRTIQRSDIRNEAVIHAELSHVGNMFMNEPKPFGESYE